MKKDHKPAPDVRAINPRYKGLRLSDAARILTRPKNPEKRIKINADKAHAEIGARINKLDTKVTSLGDHLDTMDADLKAVKGSVGHIYNALEQRDMV